MVGLPEVRSSDRYEKQAFTLKNVSRENGTNHKLYLMAHTDSERNWCQEPGWNKDKKT